MRFYEFDPFLTEIYNLTDKWLQKLESERSAMIREGKYILEESNLNDIKEYEDFIGRYITDPNNLSSGEKYFAVSLMARPLAKSIKLEYSRYLYTYLGNNQNDFIFQNFKGQEFHVPMNYKIDDPGFGACFFTTTVFTKESELDQFLLMLKLQFDKRWKVSEEIR